MTRREVLDMVAFTCEDNFGEKLTQKTVKNNWDALVDALQSEGELPKDFPSITRNEIKYVLGRVGA